MSEKLFATQDACKLVGLKSNTFVLRAKRLGIHAAKEERKPNGGRPQKFWTLEQTNLIGSNTRADVTAGTTNTAEVTEVTQVTDISTVEPAPVVDTEALIAEPLDNKSLEELADEANLYKKRGDDCMKLGLTFYFEAGRRLIEAKKRVGHGNWQNWLAQNFSASDDTATNYMKLARRFGESKSETFRNLNPATVIKLLALPEGEEERFIEEQAAAGKPIETQSARDVQKHVKEFKQRQAAKKDSDNTEPVDELQHVRADVDAEEIEAREVVAEPMPAAVSLPAQMNEPDEDTNVVTTPAQVAAIIRKLIDETDDDQQLNSLKIALTDAIILIDAKRTVIAQKN